MAKNKFGGVERSAIFVLHKCKMADKIERSYQKKKYKTEPSGIRFNIAQLKIALAKSRKDTKQELVDYLVNNYVNGENPILERQQPVYDAPRLNTNFSDELKQWQEPTQALKNWQYYMNLIPEIKTIEGCQKLDAEIKTNSLLLPNEKKILIDNLVTHSRTLYTD